MAYGMICQQLQFDPENQWRWMDVMDVLRCSNCIPCIFDIWYMYDSYYICLILCLLLFSWLLLPLLIFYIYIYHILIKFWILIIFDLGLIFANNENSSDFRKMLVRWADQFRDTPKWYHFRVSCRIFQGSLNQADLFAYMQVVAWCLIPPVMTHELGDTTGFCIGVHDASRTWIGVSFVTRNNTAVNFARKTSDILYYHVLSNIPYEATAKYG